MISVRVSGMMAFSDTVPYPTGYQLLGSAKRSATVIVNTSRRSRERQMHEKRATNGFT